jgi:hypothetical protein
MKEEGDVAKNTKKMPCTPLFILYLRKFYIMEKTMTVQTRFFNQLSEKIPNHLSLAEIVAEVLNISMDSAYRRINGKKTITLEEFYVLCRHFCMTPGHVLGEQSGEVSFRTYLLDEKSFDFKDFLVALKSDLQMMVKSSDPEVTFLLNELNLLQILQVPELTSFKLFFWAKSNMAFSGYHDSQFRIGEVYNDLTALCEEIVDLYIKIPTIELISIEILSSALKQIRYYYYSGIFHSKDDALAICDRIIDLTNHMKKQAELEYKFPFGSEPEGTNGNFRCYYNDLVLADNTILFRSGEKNMTYITTNAINLMISDNRDYFERNYQWGKNLISRSTLFSGTGEKERNKFFNTIQNRVYEQKEEIERGS